MTASLSLGNRGLLRAEGNLGHKARADAPIARGLGLAGPAFGARLRAARFRRPLGRAIAGSLVRARLGIAGSHRRVGLQILEAENPLGPLVLDQDADDAAILERAEQNLFGQGLLDL